MIRVGWLVGQSIDGIIKTIMMMMMGTLKPEENSNVIIIEITSRGKKGKSTQNLSLTTQKLGKWIDKKLCKSMRSKFNYIRHLSLDYDVLERWNERGWWDVRSLMNHVDLMFIDVWMFWLLF